MEIITCKVKVQTLDHTMVVDKLLEQKSNMHLNGRKSLGFPKANSEKKFSNEQRKKSQQTHC